MQALESRVGSSVGTMPAGYADRVVAELKQALALAQMAISKLKGITLSHKADLDRTEAVLPLIMSQCMEKRSLPHQGCWYMC